MKITKTIVVAALAIVALATMTALAACSPSPSVSSANNANMSSTSQQNEAAMTNSSNTANTSSASGAANTANTANTADLGSILYQGHGSLRITTPEGKVIYIDPFAGKGYDQTADAILVTHGHYDHNSLDLIASKTADCRIIKQDDALAGGKHNTFDLGFATVTAVQAGFNKNHDVASCVGYVITLTNGKTIYVSGDTSTTEDMTSGKLAALNLDYAFICCDGFYNMGAGEASQCADLIKAKHSVPYHSMPAEDGIFSEESAARFAPETRTIVRPGEVIKL